MSAALATPSPERKGNSIEEQRVVLIITPEPREIMDGRTAWIREMGRRTDVSMLGHQSCLGECQYFERFV